MKTEMVPYRIPIVKKCQYATSKQSPPWTLAVVLEELISWAGCSVLRLTLGDDKMLSREVANLVLSRGIRNTWPIESHRKSKKNHRRRNKLRLVNMSEIVSFD